MGQKQTKNATFSYNFFYNFFNVSCIIRGKFESQRKAVVIDTCNLQPHTVPRTIVHKRQVARQQVAPFTEMDNKHSV